MADTINITSTITSDFQVVSSLNSRSNITSLVAPTGPQGIQGDQGPTGPQGDAATITVGSVTTLPAGSSATVTNAGTTGDAILNFGIPQGDQGDPGDLVGPASSTDNAIVRFDGTTGKLVQNSSVTISDTGDVNFNAKAYLTDYGTGRSFSLDAPTGSNYIGMYAEASSVSINAQGALSVYSNSSITLDTGSGDINLTPGSGLAYVNSVPIVTTTDTQTLTNKRITPRVASVSSTTALTIGANTTDQYNVTALAANLTINAPSGTPTEGQKLLIRIKDNGTARTLTWNAIYRAVGVTLPTTTVASKTVYIGMVYNSTDTKWDVITVSQEA